MGRGPLSFKQLDVTRALRAAVAAGLHVWGFEIDKDGKIVVRVRETLDDIPKGRGGNEWDNP